LFSNEATAAFINQNFEASWEMVRPAPVIRIDFGNGRQVTRTLHGNIASYACFPSGEVFDVLPGIYTPAIYRAALDQVRQVMLAVPAAEAQQPERLRQYHRDKATTLRSRPERIVYPAPGTGAAAIAARIQGQPQAAAQAAAQAAPLDPGKRRIEFRAEQLVVLTPPANRGDQDNRTSRLPAAQNLAEWDLLVADTWRNETERRLQIHERLGQSDAVRPEQLKDWLYRDVLHVDLNDPYLGLGDALIHDDIFREVER
jgi:hypothetical protein